MSYRLRSNRHSATLLAFLVLAAAAFPIAPASACSIVLPRDYEGSARQRRDVKLAIQKASAIIDGEVIRPWTREAPALVRVHRLLKGTAGDTIQVGGEAAGGDCSIALERTGERSRMILNGGPAIYNLFYDQSQARLEDHFLKSDRRKVWPYYAGQADGG
ncbi:hypothetical protein M2341_000978 [Sphingobium sp. B7D2B]|uniref:hypothetical protein n=1 Tax=Sphingobium sp. B7D2B TaxID=2940583 RepID=UPI0022249F9C|nr:hypothetical protein [Sphingobium sp. B7D2B]MCW2365531.1 hypothetical protein [Sphingobium sp. B7D2B]